MDAARARGRGRGGRGGQRHRGGRGGRGRARNIISDDIRATLVDHVINHGLTMREAGQRVHPYPSRFTVSSIIRTFRLENRYVFNSLLSTLLRLYLEYLQYCTISHVLYCRVANAPFWTKVVVLWLPTLRCFSTFYGIYSKVQYIQYCKKKSKPIQ